jgi:gamma-carbonic anhydrase
MHELVPARAAPSGAGPLFTFEGVAPRVAADAFVAPTAAVIGDVIVGGQSSIWFHCVLRGDTNVIRVGERSNIQDGSIVHVAAGRFPCLIGNDVTIGHAAIVHACTLEDGAFVAMGATVLDGAVIEEGGILGAGGLLPMGRRIRRNELWMGAPAKLVRVLSAEERDEFDQTAVHYAALGARFRAALAPA